MSAVSFLPDGAPGSRQRVFLAAAPTPRGPYRILGLPLAPLQGDWDGGENGHAALVVDGDRLVVIYQGRAGAGGDRVCGSARFALPPLAIA
jgi:hypothetical protein